jgi:hypothetical protein
MHGNNKGLSLYSYLYLKLAKMLCFSYYVLSSTKLENKKVEQVLPGKVWGEEGGPNNLYTCK